MGAETEGGLGVDGRRGKGEGGESVWAKPLDYRFLSFSAPAECRWCHQVCRPYNSRKTWHCRKHRDGENQNGGFLSIHMSHSKTIFGWGGRERRTVREHVEDRGGKEGVKTGNV